MSFELLANELLLNVFEYFSSIDLLRAFCNLNSRFNDLLSIHFQLYSLDFRSICRNDFNLICHDYLSHGTDHIKSLILSNNDDTPQGINLFFEHMLTFRSFQYLQSLKICDLCSDELMIKIMYEWEYLPNLTHLTLAGCYFRFDENHTQQLIDRIWNLPHLIYCYFNVQFEEFNILIPTVMSSSLKYLFIWGTNHNQQEIDGILRQTPALEHFSILFNDDQNNNNIQTPISKIRKFKLVISLSNENFLIRLLERTPNLSQLTVDISFIFTNNFNQMLNGHQWENILRNYLPYLQSFRFRMEFNLISQTYTDQTINKLFESFHTSYWLEEHKWFIGYHWDSRRIFLYTLPYAFQNFHLDFSMQFKSTYSDYYLDRYYSHVDELFYMNCSKQSTDLSLLRFSKINYLHLDTPIDNNIQLILPNLSQITSLHITIHDHYTPNSLRLLINEISHLDTLKLSLDPSGISINELKNISVRRLDLQAYERCFNHKDISTLFDIQCEVLCIKIETRYLLTNLISNIKNLQILNIQCEDDLFSQTKHDDLILWLNNHMPLTYLISRDLLFPSDVQIWIR